MNKSFIFALISAIIWGASFLATKIAVEQITPSLLGFLRFLIAYVTLFIITKIMNKKEKIDKNDLPTIMMMGFTGVTLYFVFENIGLVYTSPSNASLIISSVPIFTILFNKIFLKEHINKRTIIGIFISFIGIYILIFGFNAKIKLNIKGDFIMFLAVFSWVGYTYFAKKRLKYSIITITKLLSLYGALFFIPFVIYELIASYNKIIISISGIVSLLYLGIICSALAYILWNSALRHGDTKIVNSLIYLIPLFSIITESIYYMKFPEINVYISSILIITGLFLV